MVKSLQVHISVRFRLSNASRKKCAFRWDLKEERGCMAHTSMPHLVGQKRRSSAASYGNRRFLDSSRGRGGLKVIRNDGTGRERREG